MSSTIFFFLFIPLLSFILLAVNLMFAPHNPYKEKNGAFECGFSSFLGQNRTQFSISFFIFALLFLLFDLEILLVYPYLVSAYANEIYGLAVMLIFLLALTLGFAFELGKKALTIDSRQVTSSLKTQFTRLNTIKNTYSLNTAVSAPYPIFKRFYKPGVTGQNRSFSMSAYVCRPPEPTNRDKYYDLDDENYRLAQSSERLRMLENEQGSRELNERMSDWATQQEQQVADNCNEMDRLQTKEVEERAVSRNSLPNGKLESLSQARIDPKSDLPLNANLEPVSVTNTNTNTSTIQRPESESTRTLPHPGPLPKKPIETEINSDTGIGIGPSAGSCTSARTGTELKDIGTELNANNYPHTHTQAQRPTMSTLEVKAEAKGPNTNMVTNTISENHKCPSPVLAEHRNIWCAMDQHNINSLCPLIPHQIHDYLFSAECFMWVRLVFLIALFLKFNNKHLDLLWYQTATLKTGLKQVHYFFVISLCIFKHTLWCKLIYILCFIDKLHMNVFSFCKLHFRYKDFKCLEP